MTNNEKEEVLHYIEQAKYRFLKDKTLYHHHQIPLAFYKNVESSDQIH